MNFLKNRTPEFWEEVKSRAIRSFLQSFLGLATAVLGFDAAKPEGLYSAVSDFAIYKDRIYFIIIASLFYALISVISSLVSPPPVVAALEGAKDKASSLKSDLEALTTGSLTIVKVEEKDLTVNPFRKPKHAKEEGEV